MRRLVLHLAALVVIALVVVAAAAACNSVRPAPLDAPSDGGADALAASDNPPEDAGPLPAWLTSAKVVVSAPDDPSLDCRTVICRHNENTDLFVIARKHLQGTGHKRTSLFELTGTFEGGPLAIKEWGELPSAGDTSYAGVAFRSDGKALVSWYSGRLAMDEVWLLGMIGVTNIWHGVIDFTKLP